MNMENVIEIIDSDEEGPRHTKQRLVNQKDEPGTSLLIQAIPKSKKKNIPFIDESTPSTTITVSNPTTAPPITKTARSKNRRKSMHQHLRASPNMHFETITLDDDDTNVMGQRRGIGSSAGHKVVKPQVRLTTKTNDDKALPALTDTSNAKQQMHNLIREVAEERVRINHLLLLYGIPKMDFDAYIEETAMKAEFDERLRQRKAQLLTTGNSGVVTE